MANIFSQFMAPPKSVGEFGAEMQQAQGNKLALAFKRMQQQQAEQGMADDQSMRSAYSTSGGDQGKYRNALVNAGNYKGVQALDAASLANDKGRADIGKTNAEAENKRFEAVGKKLDIAGQAFGFVKDNPTVDNAAKAVQTLMDQGVWDQATGAKAIEDVMSNPTPEGVRALATQAFQSALSAKDQLPQLFNQNRGGSFAVQSVNPVTQQATDVSSAPITQSADNAASQAQSNTNNQRSVAASRDNAAAQRDIAGAQREATMAYQNEQRALQLDKLRFEKGERDQTKETALSTVEDSLGVLDKAIKHPGRETATGISSITNPANIIPGTDARNFRVILDQIKGKAFLQAFQSLKGGGQITEVEGNKATAAIARLDTAQSDEEFKIALEELQAVMQKGYERLGGKPNAVQPAATQKPAAPAKAKSGASVSNW
jgi:hypothetical protein